MVAPRAYWWLWWGTLINRLGGFVIPLMTLYLTNERGASVTDAGSVVAVYGAGNILAAIVGGQLSDRVGRRFTMLISLFGGAVAVTALGAARDLSTVTPLVGLVGFLCELYRPAVLAFVSDVIPPRQRLAAFGLLYWAINLGFAFAAVIGGVVADIDFSILFIADAITMVAFGFVILFAIPETRPASATREERVERVDVSPLADGVFMIYVAISLVVLVLPMQAHSVLPAHMTAQGLSGTEYGIVMAVNGAFVILVQPIAVTWAQRRDAQHVLVIATLLYGLGMFMHGLATAVIAHAAAVAVWTLGEVLESPARSTVVASLAPVAARGRYQGTMIVSWGVAQVLGPKLGTRVWQDAGPFALWGACLALSIVAAAALWATARGRRARMPPVREADLSGRRPSGSS